MYIPADAPALRDATFVVDSTQGGRYVFSDAWQSLFDNTASKIQAALQILEVQAAEEYEWGVRSNERPVLGWLLPRTARLGIDTSGRVFRINQRNQVVEIGIWGLTKRELERIPEGLRRLLIA
jgi:hypothetical protein